MKGKESWHENQKIKTARKKTAKSFLRANGGNL